MSLLLEATQKHSSFAFGGSLQQAGRVLVLFGHWIRSHHFLSPFKSDFEYSFDLFLHTSPADAWKLQSALIWAESASYRSYCLKEEDLPSVLKYGKLSPVYLKIDPTLMRVCTHRQSPACALQVWSFQTSFPGPQLPTQTWLAKPPQFLQVQFLMLWNAAGRGIWEVITIAPDCHICANSCISLGLCFSCAKKTWGLNLTAAWLYNI